MQADKSLKERRKYLIQDSQDIQIINNLGEIEVIKFQELNLCLITDQYSNIQLDFENINDYNEEFNLIVFIFQVNHNKN